MTLWRLAVVPADSDRHQRSSNVSVKTCRAGEPRVKQKLKEKSKQAEEEVLSDGWSVEPIVPAASCFTDLKGAGQRLLQASG